MLKVHKLEAILTSHSSELLLDIASSQFRSIYTWLSYSRPIDWVVVGIFIIFGLGAMVFLRNRFQFGKYLVILQKERETSKKLAKTGWFKNELLPFLTVVVPARNEGFVIGNTVRQLARLDYPEDRFSIVVVVDEREMDDDVEVLTKEVVATTAQEIKQEVGIDLVHCFEVPAWYSGEFGNMDHSYGSSSKGRALNWALQELKIRPEFSEVDMVGILDADGRLDRDALINVGVERLLSGTQVLQGPVLQMSNVHSVSIVGVAAGMELAMYHLTKLPSRLTAGNKVQFLAGTNYFIEKDLIERVKGWDQTSLVEDAELAVRLYAQENVIARWLNVPEIEQTPPSCKVYVKQRERWARGHLQLLKSIRNADLPWRNKLWFFNQILKDQFRVVTDIGLPVLAWSLMLSGLFANLSDYLKVLALIFVGLTLLMLDSYGHVYRALILSIDKNVTRRQILLTSLKLFLFSPLMIFIQAWPRLIAIFKHFFLKTDTTWYKTERSREAIASV